MKRIAFTQFVNMLCATESACISNKTVPGISHAPEALFANVRREGALKGIYRKVEHRQSNAIRFEGGSWLMFKPLNKHTKRTAYEIEESGIRYLMLIDIRVPYENQFGTPIEGQTAVLLYKLKSIESCTSSGR